MKAAKPETSIKKIITQAIGVQYHILEKKTDGEYIVFLDGKPRQVIIHRTHQGFYPWYKIYHPIYGVWTGNIRKTVGKPYMVGNYPDESFWKKHLLDHGFIDQKGETLTEIPNNTYFILSGESYAQL
jgi:hypothetical protein